jgi:hypothetical protein
VANRLSTLLCLHPYPHDFYCTKQAHTTKEKADEAIETVAKAVDNVSRRGMPDLRGLPTKKQSTSKIAQEIRKNKRVDLSGRKLTKGRESQEIAELFQVYRSPKMEILQPSIPQKTELF